MLLENVQTCAQALIQYLEWTTQRQMLGQPVDPLGQQALQQIIGRLLELYYQQPLN